MVYARGWPTTYSSWAESGLLPIFINIILLDHSHVHLFMYCWQLLASYKGRAEKLQQKTIWAKKPKIFTILPFIENACWPLVHAIVWRYQNVLNLFSIERSSGKLLIPFNSLRIKLNSKCWEALEGWGRKEQEPAGKRPTRSSRHEEGTHNLPKCHFLFLEEEANCRSLIRGNSPLLYQSYSLCLCFSKLGKAAWSILWPN